MNKQLLGLAIVGLLLLAACTAPPQDLARAEVTQDSEQEESAQEVQDDMAQDTAEETNDSEVIEVSSDNSVAIDTFSSSLYFEGYAPGKSHIGQFDVYEGTLTFDDAGNLIEANGVIDTTSVATGIDGLDAHLKRDDFFDVENYPQITIESTSIETTDEQTTVQADVTLLGTTKNIAFPVDVTDRTVSANFVIDITDFNLKYTAISQEVRIEFVFVPATEE